MAENCLFDHEAVTQAEENAILFLFFDRTFLWIPLNLLDFGIKLYTCKVDNVLGLDQSCRERLIFERRYDRRSPTSERHSERQATFRSLRIFERDREQRSALSLVISAI